MLATLDNGIVFYRMNWIVLETKQSQQTQQTLNLARFHIVVREIESVASVFFHPNRSKCRCEKYNDLV
jgi:hypothetical protein